MTVRLLFANGLVMGSRWPNYLKAQIELLSSSLGGRRQPGMVAAMACHTGGSAYASKASIPMAQIYLGASSYNLYHQEPIALCSSCS